MNDRGGVKHFPGLSVEAAALSPQRKVAGIDIDTPASTTGPVKFETHHTTMPANVYHIENATHLTGLPASGHGGGRAHQSGGGRRRTRLFAILEK
jgi:kynurenine formamidase